MNLCCIFNPLSEFSKSHIIRILLLVCVSSTFHLFIMWHAQTIKCCILHIVQQTCHGIYCNSKKKLCVFRVHFSFHFLLFSYLMKKRVCVVRHNLYLCSILHMCLILISVSSLKNGINVKQFLFAVYNFNFLLYINTFFSLYLLTYSFKIICQHILFL